ncbi:hypothetical protein [Ramlibacter albus]|uniref:Uncharacterized protein n=1 Tax=Ramlibacter albus TaxID=2079448 RepID=A0A923M6H2_9BURK|nr:hypothetical protein [Ramlibacter albus]MBC5763604.1 hypothetical protein [Ramlibacter albus]
MEKSGALRLGAALVSVLLVSCGGGASPPPVRPAPLAQAPAPQLQVAAADASTTALRAYQAFYNAAPGFGEYATLLGQAGGGSAALATQFAADFANYPDTTFSTMVLANMGVTAQSVNPNSYNILYSALVAYFGAYPSSARGQIVANLIGILVGLESDVTWGSAARAFNTRVTSNRTYSTNTSNTSASSCAASVTTGYGAGIESTIPSAGTCGRSAFAGAPSPGDQGGDGSGVGGVGGGAGVGGGFGKVLGGLMQVTDLSDGTLIGEALTDSTNGLVTVRTFNRTGPFLLTLRGRAGARYFDEGRNTLVDFPAGTVMHALVDRWDEHVGVSPLTEAAFRYALNNYKRTPSAIRAGITPLAADGDLRGLTVQQVQAANEVVRTAVNVRYVDSYTLASAKALPTPIDASSNASTVKNSRYGVSAIVNGGLVKSSQRFNPSLATPALSFAEEFARDLTDGRLDGYALDGTPAATTRTYAATRLPDWSQAAAEQLAATVGSALVPTAKSIIDVVYRMEYYNTIPLVADSSVSDARNIVIDTALLLADGTVTLFRTTNGSTITRIDNFATNVKRLFHFSTPNLRQTALPITAASDRIAQQAYMLKNDGTVWAWGSAVYCISSVFLSGTAAEQSAQIAASQFRLPGSTGDSIPSPIQVQGLSNITDMAVGKYNENWIARDANGDVFVWGRDQFGGAVYRQTPASGTGLLQTRDYMRTIFGTTVTTQSQANLNTYRVVPACIAPVRQVTPLPKADSVAASVNAQFVLTTDGRVFGWGSGYEAGFGFADASTFNTDQAVFNLNQQFTARNLNLPGVVRQLNSVKASGAAADTIYAATLTDEVYVWGGSTAAGTSPRTYSQAFGRAAPLYRDIGADIATGSNILLRDTGIIDFGNPGGGTTFIFVPSLIRVLKPVADRTWLFAKDGRIYEMDASRAPVDITPGLRAGSK